MSTCTPPPGGQACDRPVPVSELFYSFQGEGVNLGRRALFVRFAGCNLTCGYAKAPGSARAPAEGKMLCDTEYTWNRAKYDLAQGVRYLTPQEIWAELVKLDPATTRPSIAPVDLIVASGGEPLLRKQALLHLAVQARMDGAADGDRDQRHHQAGRGTCRGRGGVQRRAEARHIGGTAHEEDQGRRHRRDPGQRPGQVEVRLLRPRGPGRDRRDSSPNSG